MYRQSPHQGRSRRSNHPSCGRSPGARPSVALPRPVAAPNAPRRFSRRGASIEGTKRVETGATRIETGAAPRVKAGAARDEVGAALCEGGEGFEAELLG